MPKVKICDVLMCRLATVSVLLRKKINEHYRFRQFVNRYRHTKYSRVLRPDIVGV